MGVAPVRSRNINFYAKIKKWRLSKFFFRKMKFFGVASLATQGTDKVTAKTTYVLLVKIVTDEPIKSPNFYR